MARTGARCPRLCKFWNFSQRWKWGVVSLIRQSLLRQSYLRHSLLWYSLIPRPCITDCIIISYLIATPNNPRIIARNGYWKYDHECRKAHQIKPVCGTCYAHEFNLNAFRHERSYIQYSRHAIDYFILQSVHLLYKYAIRINFCFIRTRRINFSYYTNKLFSLRINFPGT